MCLVMLSILVSNVNCGELLVLLFLMVSLTGIFRYLICNICVYIYIFMSVTEGYAFNDNLVILSKVKVTEVVTVSTLMPGH